MELVIKIPAELYEAYKGRPPMLGDAGMDMIAQSIANGTPLPKCKDCKYFEYDDRVMLNETPLIVAHEICERWGNGCNTSEDGYCFLFEVREVTDADSD